MAEPERVAPENEPRAVTGYTFGPFRLDLAGYELLKDGHKIELTTKAFDTLTLLVRHRHRVVVKEELLAAVWPDATVTDDSLIQSISAIRRALGDEASNPRYITTVARRGYRFVAPTVEYADTTEPAAVAASQASQAASTADVVVPLRPAPLPTPRRRALGPLIAVASGIGLIALGWMAGQQDVVSATSASGVLRFTQEAPRGTTLTSGGILSPDGTHLAFTAKDEASGRTAVFVRTLDAREARRLDGTEGAARPFWSPDSQFIGFFAEGRLRTIAVAGGPVTVLAQVGPRPAGGAWNARGQMLFGTWLSELWQIGPSGGAPSPATKLADGEVSHAWPAFLPDGDHFIYSAVRAGGRSRIVLGSLSSTATVPLFEADAGATYSPDGYLLFTRGGVLSAQSFDVATLQLRGESFNVIAGTVQGPNMTNGTSLSASRGRMLAFGGATGESELGWFDRTGRRLSTLNASVPLHNPVLSADERQVFGNTYPPAQQGLWATDLERGATNRLLPDGSMPMPSPDGRTLAFSSTRAPTGYGLYTRPIGRTDAATDQLLLATGERKAITDWSADGRRIVYQAFAPGKGQDLWVVGVEGGTPTALATTPANEIHGRLSPDGRWLAYASDETGRWEVYVQGFPDGSQRLTASTDGGSEPQWRRDGRELFYLAENHTLMGVDITSGATIQVGRPRALFRPQLLGEPTTYRSHYAVSRDGQRFLVDVVKAPSLDPITILLNWTR